MADWQEIWKIEIINPIEEYFWNNVVSFSPQRIWSTLAKHLKNSKHGMEKWGAFITVKDNNSISDPRMYFLFLNWMKAIFEMGNCINVNEI